STTLPVNTYWARSKPWEGEVASQEQACARVIIETSRPSEPTRRVSDLVSGSSHDRPLIFIALPAWRRMTRVPRQSALWRKPPPRQRLLVIAQIDVLLRRRGRAALELRAQFQHVANAFHVERAFRIEALHRRVEGCRRDVLRQLEPLDQQADR